MTVYIPVGISGSGKSTYQKENLPNVKVICPDTIRLKLTGDVSDQSMNTDVWTEAYNELADYVEKRQDVYFSSTNLSTKAIGMIIDKVEETKKKKTPVYYKILIMTDSNSEDLCRARVSNDLKNNVVRSNTLTQVVDDDGNLLDYDVIHKQAEAFKVVIKELRPFLSDYLENEKEIDYEILEV